MLEALTDLQHYQSHSWSPSVNRWLFNLSNIYWVNNTVSGGNSTLGSWFFYFPRCIANSACIRVHMTDLVRNHQYLTSYPLLNLQDFSQPSPIGSSEHVCLQQSFVCWENPFSNKFLCAKGDYISMSGFRLHNFWKTTFSEMCTSDRQILPSFSGNEGKPPASLLKVASKRCKSVNCFLIWCSQRTITFLQRENRNPNLYFLRNNKSMQLNGQDNA